MIITEAQAWKWKVKRNNSFSVRNTKKLDFFFFFHIMRVVSEEGKKGKKRLT